MRAPSPPHIIKIPIRILYPFFVDLGCCVRCVMHNERAINQSVRNLLLTILGERPFQPSIGSRVKGLLFEPWDPFSKDAIRTEIEDCLERLEPRITVQDVRVEDNSDLNEIQVELEYLITGENITQEVTFLLEKT